MVVVRGVATRGRDTRAMSCSSRLCLRRLRLSPSSGRTPRITNRREARACWGGKKRRVKKQQTSRPERGILVAFNPRGLAEEGVVLPGKRLSGASSPTPWSCCATRSRSTSTTTATRLSRRRRLRRTEAAVEAVSPRLLRGAGGEPKEKEKNDPVDFDKNAGRGMCPSKNVAPPAGVRRE